MIQFSVRPQPQITPVAVEPVSTSDEDKALISQIGKPAPDFALPNPQGQIVRLSSFRGQWIILIFYPTDVAKITLEQFESYGKKKQDFKSRNVSILSISTQSITTKRLISKNRLISHILLSDWGGKVCMLYKSLDKETKLAKRVTFYINPKGIVSYVDTRINFKTVPVDSLRILSTLKP
jgi:thioredoxin-dependent peroxiredoxin